MKARKTAQKRRSTGHRGPSLDRETILDAALEIIDTKGVDGFTVRTLARTLGVYPTAIYWYIPNRNALLAAVADHAMHDILPTAPPDDWRMWLRQLFHRFRAAMRRHPNVAPLTGAQLISNSGVRPELIEQALTALEAAGFEGERLRHAYNVVIAVMVGFVTIEFASMPPDAGTGWAEGVRDTFRAADPAKYPTLARYLPLIENRAFVVRWQNGVEVPLDDSFEAYVEVAIRGLEWLAADAQLENGR